MSERITQEMAPCLAWAVTLGRRLTDKEFELFMNLLDERSRAKAGKYADRGEATRYVLIKLLPRLLLYNEHPTIQPNHWVYSSEPDGKQFVESKAYTAKVLGYDIDWQASLIIMNYAWGSKEQVRHVGVAVEQLIPTLPEHKTGQVLLNAHLHELSPSERQEFKSDMQEDVIIRRLCILLTLKRAYVRAIGQVAAGFDYATIDCKVPQRTIFVRGARLTGWEFRLSMVNMGVYKSNVASSEEKYQCACAVYRGGEETVFLFDDTLETGGTWLHFISVEAIVSNVPRGSQPESLTSASSQNSDPGSQPRRIITRKRVQKALSSNSSSTQVAPSQASASGSGSKP